MIIAPLYFTIILPVFFRIRGDMVLKTILYSAILFLIFSEHNYVACGDSIKCFSKRLSSTVIYDSLELGSYLLSTDSLKIAAACAPLYGITRCWDEPLQCCFYDGVHHKNIRQLPPWCHSSANVGVIAVPMLALGACALFAQDIQLRTTAQIFVLGLPFTWATKRALKLGTFDCCLRPRNQYFSRTARAHGGFPSGHMLEIAYMTTLIGLQYGARWGAVLGVGAGFLAVDFVVCNRHYMSQLVAGAALGIMFGVAANKLVESKLMRMCTVSLSVEKDHATELPVFQVAYAF